VEQVEKEKIIRFYEDRYKRYGYDHKTVGWSSWDQQSLRFQVLSEIAFLQGSTVCDIGCGFGDLFDYLKANSQIGAYYGYDLVPTLIREAATRHSHVECEFAIGDLLEEGFQRTADYFMASGTFNYRMKDNSHFVRRMLTKMFHLSHSGVAVNFLSTYVDYQDPINFHCDPAEMFAFAKQLTRYVTLRHDYPLWEFTLYLYKNR